MPVKLASNLSFMFTECSSFIERYELAKRAGFKAVESGFPFECNISEVKKAKEQAGVDQVLINVITGDVTKGQLGFAAIPGEEKDFEDSINVTIDAAKLLNCPKIHVMAGLVAAPTDENHLVYEKNLQYAAKKFEKNGIIGLIEPINKYSVPNYYLNSFERGLKVIKTINSPNLKLLVDIFHLQHIAGNISHFLKENISYIGHVQIAQVPNRNEPDTPGELDLKYILSLLNELGYNDYVGLEYRPKGKTNDGLKWIKQFGYCL